MKENTQKVFDGVLAMCYIVLLLGSAPFVPSCWFFLENHFQWYRVLPQLVAALLVIVLFCYLPKKPMRRVLGFSLFVGLFFYSMSRLERPVEQIHFTEYGALSFFLFKMARHGIRPPWCHGASVLGAFGVGLVDELFQGFLPNRVYDPRDILINLWAGGLGMFIFAYVLTPQPF